MKQYKVTCKKCSGSNVIAVDDKSHQIFWKGCDRIISGRFRLDNNWGWQCLCQNNDIMTEQEKRMIADPANPKPKELSDIIKDLKPQKPKFIMELI